MSQHLRRRRDLHEGSRNSAAGSGAAAAALDLSSSGAAAAPRSSSGAHGSGAGFGAVRRQGSGIDCTKDKSAPHSLAGGMQAFQEAGLQGGSDSPKIGAYHGPISSITKHYFMVRLRQMWRMRAAPTGHLLMCEPCSQAAPAGTSMCTQLPVAQQGPSLLMVSADCISLLGSSGTCWHPLTPAVQAAAGLMRVHWCH